MATAQPTILPKPVDWDELYPGRFIKAVDFKGKRVTLRIAKVDLEDLEGDKGKQRKGVIGFESTEKLWALNKTNGICLKEMFGKKVQEWVGKRVTLFPAQYDGEDCIRVWGSPELEVDREITISLPRKRPFKWMLHAVKPVAKAVPTTPAATDPAPEAAPEQQESTGLGD